MIETGKKVFDLDKRTLHFSREIREFVRHLPRTIGNREDLSQLVRSSGSVGANYLEASESLGKKDFIMRLKISRKEAKETIYWLHLVDTGGLKQLNDRRELLVQEATELMRIFGSIIVKSSKT